ncbi:hypothetical protein ACR777_02920 [Sphingobacterium spiritivorum]|uniref:hypothetical protein n=1 Tax=Sphingobacterium spiritivorum TaxID=258 RepID=UPI003DA501EB
MKRRSFVKKTLIFNLYLGLGIHMVSCIKDENVRPSDNSTNKSENLDVLRERLGAERIIYITQEEKEIEFGRKISRQRFRIQLDSKLYKSYSRSEHITRRRDIGTYIVGVLVQREAINVDKLRNTKYSNTLELIAEDIVRINYSNPAPLLKSRKQKCILNCIQKDSLFANKINLHKINI